MSEQPKTLYERLGGYDAIAAVANDLLPRLQADPQLARFLPHRGADGIQREKQLLIDFLGSSVGGPVYYRGRDMVLTHRGMRISADRKPILLVRTPNAKPSPPLAKPIASRPRPLTLQICELGFH